MDNVQLQWSNDLTLLPYERVRLVARPSRPHGLVPNIPAFPKFAPLSLDHQYEIEQWVKQFPPYSDFNFVSLWAWNTTGECEVSWLGENLVVLFIDYGDNERFLSFLGVDDVEVTAGRLLRYAKTHGIVEELRLLPEVTAQDVSRRSGLSVWIAPEHQDYLYSTRELRNFAGKHFKNKRTEVKGLKEHHGAVCREIDLGDTSVQSDIDDVFGRWAVGLNRAGQQGTINEAVAIRRLFSLNRPQDLLGIGCFVDEHMVGFTINELLPHGFAMGHQCKATREFHGITPFLYQTTAECLIEREFDRLNMMQDLGLPGLRQSKEGYQPSQFLRKYALSALPGNRQRSERPYVQPVEPSPIVSIR